MPGSVVGDEKFSGSSNWHTAAFQHPPTAAAVGDRRRVGLEGADRMNRPVEHDGDLRRRQQPATGDPQDGVDIAGQVRTQQGGILDKLRRGNPSVRIDYPRLWASNRGARRRRKRTFESPRLGFLQLRARSPWRVSALASRHCWLMASVFVVNEKSPWPKRSASTTGSSDTWRSGSSGCRESSLFTLAKSLAQFQ